MPKITKANALWHAERVIDPIQGPGPGGIAVTLARPGDWVAYQETQDGELVFKAFLTESDYLEKFVRVSGQGTLGFDSGRR